MAAILNSAMLDSDTAILYLNTLLSSLRFTQKHSHSTLTLTQTNSIQLTWWWQPSWILPSCTLPSCIWPFCLKLWLQLIQFNPKSFILTQLDDGCHLLFCHLEFCHLGIGHFAQNSDSKKFNLTPSHLFSLNLMMATILNSAILDSAIFFLQKNFTHSFWLNLMMAAILNSANLNSTILDSAILLFPLKLTHTCQDWFPLFVQEKLHSFILTQLDDGSHFEFCHVGFRHCHLGFRHLVFFSQIYSKTLWLHSDSDSN